VNQRDQNETQSSQSQGNGSKCRGGLRHDGEMKKSLLAAALLVITAAAGFASDSLLWYREPANDGKPMDEALAIGNGRMGGLILGSPGTERIIVNEDSLWTGDENPSGEYDLMGAYQVLGNLLIDLPGHQDATDYRRDLDIGDALAHDVFHFISSS